MMISYRQADILPKLQNPVGEINIVYEESGPRYIVTIFGVMHTKDLNRKIVVDMVERAFEELPTLFKDAYNHDVMFTDVYPMSHALPLKFEGDKTPALGAMAALANSLRRMGLKDVNPGKIEKAPHVWLQYSFPVYPYSGIKRKADILEHLSPKDICVGIDTDYIYSESLNNDEMRHIYYTVPTVFEPMTSLLIPEEVIKKVNQELQFMWDKRMIEVGHETITNNAEYNQHIESPQQYLMKFIPQIKSQTERILAEMGKEVIKSEIVPNALAIVITIR